MTVDYLIVGQGISGTFLSWNLFREGKNVLVIDESRACSASKVASGVINPITGRRMVKTWMIDELLPFATDEYKQFGKELNVHLATTCDILLFHPTRQMSEAFEQRYAADKQFVAEEADENWSEYFYFHFGVGKITPCLHIDLNQILHRWRELLREKDLLIEDRFSNDRLVIGDDSVSYDNITAKKIIFCNGTDAFQLPYFQLLPYATNKGEAVIVRIPGLPAHHIYKQSLSIVPWMDELFWVGSTYEWEYDDPFPTESFRKKAAEQLTYWLKLPFTIVDHLAAERPATLERRPFVGLHPLHPCIGIFNGMGTKGCSLAPYFAKQFTQHLIHHTSITPEADIQRFKRVLSQRLS